jgi:hypothetical protein
VKGDPTLTQQCEACGDRREPKERAVLEGVPVWRCIAATPCLNRARRAGIGMWDPRLSPVT